jgi:hypothetical protein
MKKAPIVGTRVRMTGEFLRNTGQFAGYDGPSRWIVQACECGLCRTGRFIAVDEMSTDDPTRNRHINVGNLEKCR